MPNKTLPASHSSLSFNLVRRRCLLTAGIFLAACATSPASTSTWNGGTTGSWSSAGSWNGTDTPPLSSDTASFGGSTTAKASLNGTPASINSITIGNTGTTTISEGSAASTLTIGGAGTTGLTVNSGAGAVIIGSTANALTVALNGNQTWANNSSNGVTVNAGITNASASAPVTLSLGGSTRISIAGTISDGSTVGGGTTALSLSSGTAILTGNNTYSGGTSISGGTLDINSNTAIGRGALNINGGSLDDTGSGIFVLSNNNTINVNASFAYAGTDHSLDLGGGNQIFTNNDTVTVNGVNLFFGGNVSFATTTTTLTVAGGGALQFGNTNASGVLSAGGTWSGAATNTITINSGGALKFDVANGSTIANNITNNGNLAGVEAAGVTNTFSGAITGGTFTQAGAGTTVFDGTVSSTVVFNSVSGATIQIGNGSTSGTLSSGLPSVLAGTTLAFDNANGSSISGNITDNGTVVGVEGSGIANTLTGTITGTGTFIQTGAGETILSGVNTYSGGTTISTGTLGVANPSGLGTGTVTLGTAETIQLLSNTTATFTSGAVVGSSSGSTVTFNVDKLSAGSGNTLSFALTNGLSFTNGNTVLNQINVTGADGYGLALGAISTSSAATSFPTNFIINATTAPVSIASFTAGSFGNTLVLEGGNAITLGNLSVLSNGSLFVDVNGADVSLNGTTTYGGSAGGGSVTLNTGTLNINNAGAVTKSGLIINGGTLNNTSGGTITETPEAPTTINSSFTFTGSNSLNLGTGGVSYIGTDTITVSSNNTLTLGGTNSLSGSGLILAGTGSLTLGGLEAFGSGNTVGNIGTGTLTVGVVSNSNGGAVDFSVGTGATSLIKTTGINGSANGLIMSVLDTVNGGADFAAVNSSGQIVAENSLAAETALPVSGASSTKVYFLTGSLVETGSNTPGVLRINDTGTSDSLNTGAFGITIGGNGGTGILYNGGTNGQYTISGTGYVGAGTGHSFFINTYAGQLTISAPVVDAGGGTFDILTKGGAGTLVLTGSNVYTGATTVGGGTLDLGNGNTGSFAGTGAITIASGATLNLGLANGSTLAASILNDGGSFVGNENSGVTNILSGEYGTSGSINSSGITQNGPGTTVLAGANFYTGATVINAGVIELTNAQGLGSASHGTSGVTVNSGAALQLKNIGTTTGTYTLALNGTGVTGAANGALENISGTNTYNGAITLDSNASIGSDAGSLTASGAINNAGFTLSLIGAGDTTLANTVAGSGGLDVNGTGTVTLSGTAANTYTGQTVVSSGELDLDKSASAVAIQGLGNETVATAPDILVNGGTLKFLANDQVANSADGSGNVTLSMTLGAVNLNGTTQTIYAFQNTGGVFTTGNSGRLVSTDANVAFGGGTNTINAGGIVEGNEFDISGGTNTVQGDGGTGLGGGTLQLDGNGNGIVLSNGANLTLDSDSSSAGQISFEPGFGTTYTISTTASSTTASITSLGTGTHAGTILLNGNTADFIVAAGTVPNGGPDLLVSAVIADGSSSGGVTKDGAGTLQLSGANTYTGATTVNSGTLQLSNGSGSATGFGALSVGAGATLSGTGSSSGSGFSVTGSSTSAVATVLVGHNSASDLNTTGVMSLQATGSSNIGAANLVFNLNTNMAGAGNQLNVGATAIAFNTLSSMNTTLTLNLQGSSIIASGTTYVLIAGTGTTATGGSQYTGLDLGTSISLGNGITETQILNSNFGGTGSLNLSFGSANSYYGAKSFLFLYQNANTGVDDIEVDVVPEPGTWAMMLGSLAMLIVWQRARRKNLRS